MKTIKSKITFLFVVTISFILFIGIYFIYNRTSLIVKTMNEKLSMQISNARASELGEWFQSRQIEMYDLANSEELKSMNSEKYGKYLKKIFEKKQEFYELLFVVDTSGNTWSTAGPLANLSDRDYVKKILNSETELFVSKDIYISRATGNYIFTVAHAIKNDEEKVIGIIAGTADLKKLSETISNIKIGENGYAWIVDGNFTIAAHKKNELIGKLNFKEGINQGFKGLESLAKKMMNNNSGIEEMNVNGLGKAYAFYTKIPNSPSWFLGITSSEKDNKKEINKILFYFIIIFFIIILFIVIVSTFISTQISKPIMHIVSQFKNLASGDLTTEVNIKTGDELEILADNFNIFTFKLENIISEIKEGAKIISISSNEINNANQNLAEKTTTQAAALEETSATMEEMSSIIINNTSKTEDADKMMLYTAKKSEEIETLSLKLNHSIEDISTSSKKIENIINVIDEIAFQTNLLALNAAVEAARAGDQGRGFAVVAVEVRNLAQRSSKASKEIKELIVESVTKVEQGTKFVDQTIHSIKEIVVEVKKGSNIIADITSSAKEQMTGIEQINKSIIDLDEVTQTNAGIAEETSASTNLLSNKAQEFFKLISFFKVKD